MKELERAALIGSIIYLVHMALRAWADGVAMIGVFIIRFPPLALMIILIPPYLLLPPGEGLYWFGTRAIGWAVVCGVIVALGFCKLQGIPTLLPAIVIPMALIYFIPLPEQGAVSPPDRVQVVAVPHNFRTMEPTPALPAGVVVVPTRVTSAPAGVTSPIARPIVSPIGNSVTF